MNGNFWIEVQLLMKKYCVHQEVQKQEIILSYLTIRITFRNPSNHWYNSTNIFYCYYKIYWIFLNYSAWLYIICHLGFIGRCTTFQYSLKIIIEQQTLGVSDNGCVKWKALSGRYLSISKRAVVGSFVPKLWNNLTLFIHNNVHMLFTFKCTWYNYSAAKH